MAHKEVWEIPALVGVSKFAQDLQDFIQENQSYYGFRVKDMLLVLEDEDKPRGGERVTWGLISLNDRDDTVLQFEQGDFEIGPQ